MPILGAASKPVALFLEWTQLVKYRFPTFSCCFRIYLHTTYTPGSFQLIHKKSCIILQNEGEYNCLSSMISAAVITSTFMRVQPGVEFGPYLDLMSFTSWRTRGRQACFGHNARIPCGGRERPRIKTQVKVWHAALGLYSAPRQMSGLNICHGGGTRPGQSPAI